MKALIINYNRLTLTRNLADWCAAHGLDVVIIDNGSDYPPLLDYYANTPHMVHRLPANYGHTVVWLLGLEKLYAQGERYIVTDPDLDLAGVPPDFLQVLHTGLDRYRGVDKCGLSLEVNDLPDTPEAHLVRTQYEVRYWQHPLDPMYFQADTDTTFALYRENVHHYGHSAVRTNRPYTARHLPWYYVNLASLPTDEQHYFTTANDSSSGKKRLVQ
jgi:hypothetical protein